MKSVRTAVLIILSFSLVAGIAFAADQASAEKGKALFNDPKLGTTGQSCNDCHPNGKGADKAAAKKDIDRIVNSCITHSIKGQTLDAKSMEMQSLVMYIKSLGEKTPTPKKPAVGC
jgi:cytochrome c peroxidase